MKYASKKIEAAFKLSQNRNDEDSRNIIAELKAPGNTNAVLMAKEMEERLMTYIEEQDLRGPEAAHYLHFSEY